MNDIDTRITASFATQGLLKTLGAKLVSITAGEVQIELQFNSCLSQQHGHLHAPAAPARGHLVTGCARAVPERS